MESLRLFFSRRFLKFYRPPRQWNRLAKKGFRSPLRPLKHTQQKLPMPPTQCGLFPGGGELCAEVSGAVIGQYDESSVDELAEFVVSIGGGVEVSFEVVFGNGPEQF